MDRQAWLTGSLNLTDNGFYNNEEEITLIIDAEAVKTAVESFEKVWVAARPVTDEDIEEANTAAERRQQQYRNSYGGQGSNTEATQAWIRSSDLR